MRSCSGDSPPDLCPVRSRGGHRPSGRIPRPASRSSGHPRRRFSSTIPRPARPRADRTARRAPVGLRRRAPRPAVTGPPRQSEQCVFRRPGPRLPVALAAMTRQVALAVSALDCRLRRTFFASGTGTITRLPLGTRYPGRSPDSQSSTDAACGARIIATSRRARPGKERRRPAGGASGSGQDESVSLRGRSWASRAHATSMAWTMGRAVGSTATPWRMGAAANSPALMVMSS